jgi:prepilin-type N-terminal cleavage/methylation domain-containing protein
MMIMGKQIMFWKSQRGFSLIEILVTLALISSLGVSLLAGLATSSVILNKTDLTETAKDLAVAQMEEIKSSPFNVSSYDEDSSLFTPESGYSANITVDSLNMDGNLQKITISVLKAGYSSPVYTLTDYRMR